MQFCLQHWISLITRHRLQSDSDTYTSEYIFFQGHIPNGGCLAGDTGNSRPRSYTTNYDYVRPQFAHSTLITREGTVCEETRTVMPSLDLWWCGRNVQNQKRKAALES
jgi:hypothetical protein